ncbi:type IV inositol polyphosphate 5-phosphatase 7-like [Camellia sinensis]|uniref:type IV inositol polyphosphate 5-phosphatase 7-like n=1 Tax=Camellia sinensis TaxID=4442 RepID=UPI001035C03F|nr:type IV inositol polyphosphate 5-phosphatase 7-like [Camellia sinensis]XP_028108179.1 type IV inositol polyphosphate 5-phosphatase 7-like [Camellia sinensis]XP_028108180.1 type IV inositol polyphosphate 5-phosphatase 7-like [Camellia sinensis]XP_028108181.1 type IV inositol polyphosphate 5-phosphatase 7-like [Camellia sinensis]XP_028108183.1 type IV inositol polyphosphate 5-phosphatase 7-like [Camellia sinensis]
MRDGNSKKSKLSWSKSLVRKLFNIKSKTEEFQADEVVYGGGDVEWGNSFSEREPCTIKKSRTEKLSKNTERARRGRADLDHPQIINVQNYSIFVATWNVGGKSPSSNLNLDDFLHSSPPADIYVLGFQEIVPLNAGNILGSENNGPARKWFSLIQKTLNNLPGTSGGSGCYTPSPIPDPIAESDADFEGSMRQNTSFFHRRSFQTPCSWGTENDSVSQPRLDRRYSVCDRVIFGHRPSDYDPNSRSSHRPSDSSWSHRPSDASWGHRPSDHSWGHRPSDYSRWGSSDDDYWPGDSPSTVLFSPMSNAIPMEDGYRVPGHPRYCLVASKQMVGIYLTIWVKSDLREHVRNMKVSCVGRGLMGYLGNKGSISVSMLLHQTSFCFVCSHLTSGQKEGDELRRNSDVMEILRKTRFPGVHSMGDEKSPETILEHDRIIWLGDLNYRIAMSFRSAKALVEMQNWRALLEKDQLRIEQRRGRVFHGWNEGKIYFPPTYKYSNNSDRYAGDDMHPKEKRRTPAWCDRILWYGGGLQQVSYVRGESRFSDHRPVYSIFWAEVESYQGRFRKTMSCSNSRIEVEELLSYSNGYTELCFF